MSARLVRPLIARVEVGRRAGGQPRKLLVVEVVEALDLPHVELLHHVAEDLREVERGLAAAVAFWLST